MNRMAANDKYEYINEESISERLKCAICSNPFIDPVKTKCKPKDHTFCRHCIEEWLQRNLTCPSCRQNVENQDLTPITEGILLDMLSELPVKCPFCKRTGLERGNVDAHINTKCPKQKISCSSADIKCPWTGPNAQLEQHLQTCPYTALRTMLIQIITDNRQLTEQVNQQQSLTDKLQKENRQLKEQSEQQKIQIPKPPNESRPPKEQKRPRENTARSPMPNNGPSTPPKVSCVNCSDCWRGVVRGTYFRGHAGGGFKPGTTMLPCDCDCHK